MIIGVSGKLGSGKDLVGNIIHFLIARENKLLSTKSVPYKDWVDYSKCSTGWETKKYAYKLKQIVALLLGCTVEKLEDREFKEKELSKEWWYFESKTKKLYPYLKYRKLFLNLPNSYKLIKLTPRKILQLLGTDAGRDIIHPNIWVNALMSDYKEDLILSPLDVDNEIGSRWIITDMRFPNELDAVKFREGITIRVNREPYKWVDVDEYKFLTGKKVEKIKEHPSETALDNAEFDYIIGNNGTIEELVEKVKEILIKEGILNE